MGTCSYCYHNKKNYKINDPIDKSINSYLYGLDSNKNKAKNNKEKIHPNKEQTQPSPPFDFNEKKSENNKEETHPLYSNKKNNKEPTQPSPPPAAKTDSKNDDMNYPNLSGFESHIEKPEKNEENNCEKNKDNKQNIPQNKNKKLIDSNEYKKFDDKYDIIIDANSIRYLNKGGWNIVYNRNEKERNLLRIWIKLL